MIVLFQLLLLFIFLKIKLQVEDSKHLRVIRSMWTTLFCFTCTNSFRFAPCSMQGPDKAFTVCMYTFFQLSWKSWHILFLHFKKGATCIMKDQYNTEPEKSCKQVYSLDFCKCSDKIQVFFHHRYHKKTELSLGEFLYISIVNFIMQKKKNVAEDLVS